MKTDPRDPPAVFRPKQVYEQVADRVRASLLAGTYPPGSRLPSERDLARELNVSRLAVREAIGALQNEGLVHTRHGSGTYVSSRPPSARGEAPAAATAAPDQSPMGTLEVRMLIEPAIARLAARHGRRDAVAEGYLARMAAVKDIDDPGQQALWSECDRLFHRQLAAMSGNPLLLKIADEVAASMNEPLWQRLRDDGIYDEARIQLYVAEHRLIYEAVVDGDEEAAAFHVTCHLKRVQKDIASIE